ncbi:MAG: fumarate hydratase, partial [Lachnospiraceae bacterium]|nr:fumarate hydratase [Lachnospiraceae bacterium]
MRTIHVSQITQNIKEMCIEANHCLAPDMDCALKEAASAEKSPLGRQILNQLQDNLQIAQEDRIPICQDTGMAVIFLEIGQDVHFEGGSLEDAVNEGVRQGYVDGYLRKSVVKDPIIRENTKDNTPAVIHYELKPGDSVTITVAPKGFGSENMSRVFMLKPADGIE